MTNPRLFFRIDGKTPTDHAMLGYPMPLEYEGVNKLLTHFTEGLVWDTIQIKIQPSLIADQTRLILISNSFKHLDAPIEHRVFMIKGSKNKELIKSAETLEELFRDPESNP